MRILVDGEWYDVDGLAGKTVTQVVSDAYPQDPTSHLTIKCDGEVLTRRAHIPQDAKTLEVIEVMPEDDDGSTPEAESHSEES